MNEKNPLIVVMRKNVRIIEWTISSSALITQLLQRIFSSNWKSELKDAIKKRNWFPFLRKINDAIYRFICFVNKLKKIPMLIGFFALLSISIRVSWRKKQLEIFSSLQLSKVEWYQNYQEISWQFVSHDAFRRFSITAMSFPPFWGTSWCTLVNFKLFPFIFCLKVFLHKWVWMGISTFAEKCWDFKRVI